MKLKVLAVATLVTAGVLAAPSAAFAGEITGTGGPTGMRGHAASECGFSGLEDVPTSPLRTQTPHQVYFGGQVVNPAPGTPGTACNPAKSGG